MSSSSLNEQVRARRKVTVNLLPLALRDAFKDPTSDNGVDRASWKMDVAAIEYGFAANRKEPTYKLQRLARDLKKSARDLAAALQAEEKGQR